MADLPTTIENIPGYSAQQATVQTQGFFTLLIGILVIGGFFQIQVLQKIAQIGVLKAIGSSNGVVGAASVLQIMIVTAIGVAIGGGFTYLFSLGFPPTIPVVFNGMRSMLAVLALAADRPGWRSGIGHLCGTDRAAESAASPMKKAVKEVVLEVRDLVKTFTLDGSPVNAVDHVSFQVHAGEFVAVVGPSGSGKTTLLSILAALLTPTSGEVFIDGHELSRMSETERVGLRRARIGFTFQSNNLIPFLTAQENVEFMLRLNGVNGVCGLLVRRSCWPGLVSAAACITCPRSYPAVSSSAWPSPGR